MHNTFFQELTPHGWARGTSQRAPSLRINTSRGGNLALFNGNFTQARLFIISRRSVRNSFLLKK